MIKTVEIIKRVSSEIRSHGFDSSIPLQLTMACQSNSPPIHLSAIVHEVHDDDTKQVIVSQSGSDQIRQATKEVM